MKLIVMIHLLNNPFVKILLFLLFELLLQFVLLFLDLTLFMAFRLYVELLFLFVLYKSRSYQSAYNKDNEASLHIYVLHCLGVLKILLNQIINDFYL